MDEDASGFVMAWDDGSAQNMPHANKNKLCAVSVGDHSSLDGAIKFALERNLDLVHLDETRGLGKL